jgi:hypothetical protein
MVVGDGKDWGWKGAPQEEEIADIQNLRREQAWLFTQIEKTTQVLKCREPGKM